jgi:hypothetical protein
MLRNIAVFIGLLVVVGVISGILTYVRAGQLSPVADIQSKGLAAVQKGNLLFFGVEIPLLVGVIAFFVYRNMVVRSPVTANTSFLLLSVGVGIVLTILAAVVFKMRGFSEFTALHVVYIAALGWLMPMFWVP